MRSLRVPGSSRLGWVAVGLVGCLLIAELVGFGWRQRELQHSQGVLVASSVADPNSTDLPPPSTPATTTAVPPTTAAPVSDPVVTPDVVTYSLRAGTQIAVTATGDCYVEARPDAAGQTSYQGTLRAGQGHTFASPVWLRFGNPTKVTAKVEGTVLRMPADGPGDLVIRSS